MTAEIDASLRRLKTDYIDLYYIHWPRTGHDMRPRMEALEAARAQGKIRATGVSNFSVAQMREVQEVGTIDAHQLGYNLLWRYAEETSSLLRGPTIAVVTYSRSPTASSPASSPATPGFRRRPAPPHPAVPRRHLAARPRGRREAQGDRHGLDRPLMHLAIRWNLARPGITSVVVGARNKAQAEANVQALAGAIPAEIFDRMTAISDEIVRHVPNEGNLFNHHP